MYKIAVMGDYDSIYGFATLGLSICPVKDRDEAKTKLRQLAEGNYGIIYITEAVAAQIHQRSTSTVSRHFRRLFRSRVCRGIQEPELKA